MTLQVFEDLLKSQHETTKSTGSGAAVVPSSSIGPSSISSSHHEASSLSPPSSASPSNTTRRASLLRGGLAGLRRNLPPLSSLMEDILSKSESLASSSEHDPSGTSEHDWMELLRHRTEQDIKILIQGEDDEFRSFQEHVRYQLHMTDSAIKHNLYQLVRAHQLATEWKKHHSKRPSPSHFLPAMSIYENEFHASANSSTSTPSLTSSPGVVATSQNEEAEENKQVDEGDNDEIQRATSTMSSPQSVMMNVVQWSSNDVMKHSITHFLDETSNPSNACEEKECR